MRRAAHVGATTIFCGDGRQNVRGVRLMAAQILKEEYSILMKTAEDAVTNSIELNIYESYCGLMIFGERGFHFNLVEVTSVATSTSFLLYCRSGHGACRSALHCRNARKRGVSEIAIFQCSNKFIQ